MRIICVDDEKPILEATVSACMELSQKPETAGFCKAVDAIADIRVNGADIALLDINMPDMSGLALAGMMRRIVPDIAIIFLTAYPGYALEAIGMHASGYLLKPLSRKKLAEEVDYAAQTIELRKAKRESSGVFIRTFGNFDVLVNGEVIRFSRSRSKELLAYLVDRRGAFVSRANAFSALWENQPYDRPRQKQFDVILRSMRRTLDESGIGGIVELKSGNIRVVPDRFDCDLFRFCKGDAETVSSYRGEYMSEYEWANDTEAQLYRS